ncbi:MAG: hypothetical protein RTV31_00480 [Candidatus Thorarchaeota archaeon]
MSIRTDSKSIALLAIFTSLVIALEIFPVVGITDIPVPGLNFTVDWTGIPILIVFLGLGSIFAVFTVGIMYVFIAYRNFQGAAFKGLAESFTLLGLIIANLILRKRDLDWKKSALVYLIFGCAFRGLGMWLGNVLLFNFFFTMPYEAGFALSSIYVPWNILQAAVNIIGGVVLYQLIPESIRIQAGLGRFRTDEVKYEELSEDEVKAENE